ncbi:MAG: hypothetical protein GXO31_06595 [Epsilonproteobacteria bacterium]|nr:hypothetical protein [Campylobacterota bacterium]
MDLLEFVNRFVKKSDIYVPAAILFLINNKGKATKNQIAKLIYIFEHKKSVKEYEEIVDKMVKSVLLEYDIIEIRRYGFKLKRWPIEERKLKEIQRKCMYSLNGFFIPVNDVF